MASVEPVQGKRVLVVEDESVLAEILSLILADDLHQVDTAANGMMALERIGRQTYDLILSDLRMPELDGLGLYRELRRLHPHLLPRLIFVTGSAEDQGSREFLKDTGCPLVLKPFTMEDIHRVTQEVLRTV